MKTITKEPATVQARPKTSKSSFFLCSFPNQSQFLLEPLNHAALLFCVCSGGQTQQQHNSTQDASILRQKSFWGNAPIGNRAFEGKYNKAPDTQCMVEILK